MSPMWNKLILRYLTMPALDNERKGSLPLGFRESHQWIELLKKGMLELLRHSLFVCVWQSLFYGKSHVHAV